MEAELKFEREGRSGVVAVGTYLFDAARRMGVEVEAECGRRGECDSCAMRIKEGGEFLSEVTEKEIEHLTTKRRENGERLSCQVKIESAGEIVVMTNKKKETEKPEDEVKTEEYRKRFEDLPLEKKVASLLELEAITLGETFSFVINSPSHIFGKFMDVLAEFGFKLEEDDKNAKRPKEHKVEKAHKAEGKAHKAEKEHKVEENDKVEKDKVKVETEAAETVAGENGGKSKRRTKKDETDKNQE